MAEPHSLNDVVMQARFREIVAERGIEVIVETGIDKGLSTVTLSRMVPLVISIDNNLSCFVDADKNLREAGRTNVVMVIDNSPRALHNLRPLLPAETLYFLDAHWQDYWPLLDEIAAICPGTGVIVLHDIAVPGHPELGFDCYNGQPLCYEYVRPVLNRWSACHRIEYNDRTEGCGDNPRGIGYVFPR